MPQNKNGITEASTCVHKIQFIQLPDTSESDWQKVIDVNLKGTFWGMKYSIPSIKHQVADQ